MATTTEVMEYYKNGDKVNQQAYEESLLKFGHQQLYALSHNKNRADMQIDYERLLFSKRQSFFEKGHSKGLKILIPFLLICAISGWLFSGVFLQLGKNISAYLNLSSGAICAINLCLIGCALYNLVDIGRIYVYFEKEYLPIRKAKKGLVLTDKEVHSLEELVATIKNLLLEKGPMRTTDIKDEANIYWMRVQDIGKVISQSGQFKQKYKQKQKVWEVKIVDVEESDIEEVTLEKASQKGAKNGPPAFLLNSKKEAVKSIAA